MKPIIQSYKTGTMALEETPVPQASPGAVLVETAASLVSAGTEKMLVDLARKSLVGKARSQPDKVRQVIDKVRTDGKIEQLSADSADSRRLRISKKNSLKGQYKFFRIVFNLR